MKTRWPVWMLMLVATAAWLVPHTARAADKYQCSLVEEDNNKSSTHLTKSGSVVFAPSKKPGDGGVTTQIVLKNVTCTACSNNVLTFGVHALGLDLEDVVGIVFNVTGGQALFINGKNKTGFTGFGSLASQIFTHPLGFGIVKLRTTAADPTACNAVPLLPGNQCSNGDIYAIAGFKIPVDPKSLCDPNVETSCPITSICDPTSKLCVSETCTDDAACRSGHCNINGGTCCSPDIPPGCP